MSSLIAGIERCIRLRPYHPEHARSRPISEAKQGQGAWFSNLDGRPDLGGKKINPGAVSFCFFLHWAATTLLQASAFICVLLYPFNLNCCLSLLPFDFSVTFGFPASVWQNDSSASSFRHFSSRGAIERLFCGNYVGAMYPPRISSSNFKKFNDKKRNKLPQVPSFFWCWWLRQKLLASEQIKYSAFFSVLFWYLETGQEIHQLKKITMK